MELPRITAIYTDGGVCRQNPSPYGGSWAYVLVDDTGEVAFSSSGRIYPGAYGFAQITNNLAELAAVIKALEKVPAGWTGKLYCDSRLTLDRLARWRTGNIHKKETGVTPELIQRAQAACARHNRVNLVWIRGHDGNAFNCRCDEECTRLNELIAEEQNLALTREFRERVERED